MKRLLFVVSMCVAMNAHAQVKIGFLIVTTDAKMSQEHLDDIAEKVCDVISAEYKPFCTLTKERVAMILKYVNPKQHGAIFSDVMRMQEQVHDFAKKKESGAGEVQVIVLELKSEGNAYRMVSRFVSSDLEVKGVEVPSEYLVKGEYKDITDVATSMARLILRRGSAAIEVSIEPKTARVMIGGAQVAHKGSVSLLLVPGTYPIEVSENGYRAFSQKVKLNRGEVYRRDIALDKEVVTVVKVDPKIVKNPEKPVEHIDPVDPTLLSARTNPLKTTYRVVGGVTAAAAVGLFIGAGIATKKFKDAQDHIDRCASEICPDFTGGARDDEVADGHRNAIAADVLWPTAGLMTAASLFFFLWSNHYEDLPPVTLAPITSGGHMGSQIIFSTTY